MPPQPRCRASRAGILVVQDDANPVPEVDQNFKIVDWREVEKALVAPKAE